jgi:hypothetical protein
MQTETCNESVEQHQVHVLVVDDQNVVVTQIGAVACELAHCIMLSYFFADDV